MAASWRPRGPVQVSGPGVALVTGASVWGAHGYAALRSGSSLFVRETREDPDRASARGLPGGRWARPWVGRGA